MVEIDKVHEQLLTSGAHKARWVPAWARPCSGGENRHFPSVDASSTLRVKQKQQTVRFILKTCVAKTLLFAEMVDSLKEMGVSLGKQSRFELIWPECKFSVGKQQQSCRLDEDHLSELLLPVGRFFLSQKSKEQFYESESVHVNNRPPFGFHWGTRMLPCPVSVTRSILMLVADQDRQVVAVDAFETQAIPHRQMGIKGAHRCQCISCIFAFVLKQRRSSNR